MGIYCFCCTLCVKRKSSSSQCKKVIFYSSFSFFYSCLFLIHICDSSRRSFGIEYKGHPHCKWIFQQIVFVNGTRILLYRKKDNCLMFIHGKMLLFVASVLDSWLIRKHLYLYSVFFFMIL